MIRLSRVSKVYRTADGVSDAITDVSMEIPKGSVVLISGKNGSGKSTLMSLMCGIISPTSGRVYIDERDISRLPERFLVRIRQKQTGMIFQERFLISWLTALENLVLPLIPTDLQGSAIRMKGKELLKRFGLEDKESVRINRLSGGEKQRLIIARALINNPDIIFADEPTTHLDEDVMEILEDEVMSWRTQGRTVVMATHQPEVLKNIRPDIFIHLHKGRLAEKGK